MSSRLCLADGNPSRASPLRTAPPRYANYALHHIGICADILVIQGNSWGRNRPSAPSLTTLATPVSFRTQYANDQPREAPAPWRARQEALLGNLRAAAGGMHRYRSHTCGALRKGDVGKAVRLSGWVHRVRDHGGLLFIDLRDHYGITQVVADPDSPAFKTAETVRSEWVIRVDGKVRDRPEGTVNAELADRRDRAVRQRDRGAVGGQGAADPGVRRAGLSGGPAAASTASSTCGARRCTTTSCCATRSSARSAGACASPASSSSRRRS